MSPSGWYSGYYLEGYSNKLINNAITFFRKLDEVDILDDTGYSCSVG